MVTTRKTSDYLRSLINSNDTVLAEIQKNREENNIPILPAESANLICSIIKISNTKKVLEIGTSIGYSSVAFCRAMGKDGCITTIEMNEDTIKKAKDNFIHAGIINQVTILQGDACEIIKYMTGNYQLIFMDGPKGHYNDFVDYFYNLLSPGGIIICDNVLYHGMVTGDKRVRGRKVTIVKRMREFLKNISNDKRFFTTVIPIGDGISISIKEV